MVTAATLPNYVVINDPNCKSKEVLRKPATAMTFPLSQEDKEILAVLEKKFDAEENCAGLAATQIGYGKSAIVFAAPEDPELKKYRKDLTQYMSKTIWINPSFIPVGEETVIDWEGCFSVHNLSGQVPRYKTIRYEAFTVDGKKVQGTATGFLARLIQHEIDHLNGKLFIDYVEEDKLISREALMEMRQRDIEED